MPQRHRRQFLLQSEAHNIFRNKKYRSRSRRNVFPVLVVRRASKGLMVCLSPEVRGNKGTVYSSILNLNPHSATSSANVDRFRILYVIRMKIEHQKIKRNRVFCIAARPSVLA